jgi:hypothetical protein
MLASTLQEKLGHVAATVGKIGGTVAATCFVALLIKWCVINRGFPLSKINDNGPVQVRRAGGQYCNMSDCGLLCVSAAALQVCAAWASR